MAQHPGPSAESERTHYSTLTPSFSLHRNGGEPEGINYTEVSL